MEKHTGIFNGQIMKKRYEVNMFWDINDISVDETWEIEYDKISECEFDRPPLNNGDKVHLHELDEIVVVNDAIRSTSGAFIYNTSYVIKKIEDDETPKSKQKAEERKNEIIKRSKERKEEIQKENDSPKKKWYQFWK